MGGGAREVSSAIPSCGQHCIVSTNAVQGAVFHVQTNSPNAAAILQTRAMEVESNKTIIIMNMGILVLVGMGRPDSNQFNSSI